MSVAAPAAAQRLPGGVSPTQYELTVAPDLETATFTGDETIHVTLARPLRAIVLNAAEIRFNTVTITAAGRSRSATVTLDDAREQASLSVAAPLPPGPATIHITYTGILNDELRGLYLSKANNRRYAVTQLEATDARRMFPSFDEPEYKATFALTAVIDASDRAISNGTIVSDRPGPGRGKHTIVFATTPPMSTYLVALAVGDFECLEGGADDIPIRVCSTPDKKRLTGFALQSAEEIMRYYDRYYSIRYPFKKLDIVAVPDFSAGAMENTAAIFYRETLLLADPENASVGVRKSVAQVLAHEMAHQWFGDLVTMKWWDDIWLNEGFANWMETKPLKAWKPEWHSELDEVRSNETAMALDALRSTRPIRAQASTPAQINELFDPIAYEKGAAVLRMVESWLGQETFRKGVNAYLEKFKYRNARAEDFWTTMSVATGQPVAAVMASFVDQPGVPLVTAGISCGASGASVTLSQERYVADNTSPPPAGVWRIPVCVRTPEGKTSCDVIATKSASLAVASCPAWVMSNAGARGYYRTGYSSGVVRKLGADVESLAPAERIAVLSDEWALVRAGRNDVGSFLDLASGFARERTAAVMETLATTLDAIGDEFTTKETSAAYRAWVSGLLRPVLEDIGWMPRTGEPEDRGTLRATVIGTLGRTARDPDVLDTARDLVRQELSRPGTVSSTLLDVLVDIAAIGGNSALYEDYVARSRTATAPEERYRYLYGLAAFTDPALVRRTMDEALGAEVRTQDTKILISRMLLNPETRTLAWQLLQARWNEVQRKTGEAMNNTGLVASLEAFCDSTTAAQMKTFFASHPVPDAERTLQQAIERVTSCARLAGPERRQLADWLKRTRS